MIENKLRVISILPKVKVDKKEYIEKEALFYEMERLLKQDYKDMNKDEINGAEIALQRLQNILF